MDETPLSGLGHAVYVRLVRVYARVHTLDRFKFEITRSHGLPLVNPVLVIFGALNKNTNDVIITLSFRS